MSGLSDLVAFVTVAIDEYKITDIQKIILDIIRNPEFNPSYIKTELNLLLELSVDITIFVVTNIKTIRNVNLYKILFDYHGNQKFNINTYSKFYRFMKQNNLFDITKDLIQMEYFQINLISMFICSNNQNSFQMLELVIQEEISTDFSIIPSWYKANSLEHFFINIYDYQFNKNIDSIRMKYIAEKVSARLEKNENFRSLEEIINDTMSCYNRTFEILLKYNKFNVEMIIPFNAK